MCSMSRGPGNQQQQGSSSSQPQQKKSSQDVREMITLFQTQRSEVDALLANLSEYSRIITLIDASYKIIKNFMINSFRTLIYAGLRERLTDEVLYRVRDNVRLVEGMVGDSTTVEKHFSLIVGTVKDELLGMIKFFNDNFSEESTGNVSWNLVCRHAGVSGKKVSPDSLLRSEETTCSEFNTVRPLISAIVGTNLEVDVTDITIKVNAFIGGGYKLLSAMLQDLKGNAGCLNESHGNTLGVYFTSLQSVLTILENIRGRHTTEMKRVNEFNSSRNATASSAGVAHSSAAHEPATAGIASSLDSTGSSIFASSARGKRRSNASVDDRNSKRAAPERVNGSSQRREPPPVVSINSPPFAPFYGRTF
jgi:hypothetical protein